MSVVLKQGDTWPPVRATLKDENGPVDLTGCTVKFRMSGPSGANTVNESATITDAANGKVMYTWQKGDTKVVGQHRAEFVVTFANGKRATFPNNNFIFIQINEDVPKNGGE